MPASPCSSELDADELGDSPLVPSVRGDLLERAGRHAEAAAAFTEAAARIPERGASAPCCSGGPKKTSRACRNPADPFDARSEPDQGEIMSTATADHQHPFRHLCRRHRDRVRRDRDRTRRRRGRGRPLPAHMGTAKALIPLLSEHYAVFAYDRRGRGESGPGSSPFAVQREVEDLVAVLEAAGPDAFVVGASSGAALVLEALRAGVPVRKVALYEAPFIVDDTHAPHDADLGQRTQQLVDAGRQGDAVAAVHAHGGRAGVRAHDDAPDAGLEEAARRRPHPPPRLRDRAGAPAGRAAARRLPRPTSRCPTLVIVGWQEPGST